MKLTIEKLRQIIREEVENAANEAWKPGMDPAMRPGRAKVGPTAREKRADRADPAYKPRQRGYDQSDYDWSATKLTKNWQSLMKDYETAEELAMALKTGENLTHKSRGFRMDLRQYDQDVIDAIVDSVLEQHV